MSRSDTKVLRTFAIHQGLPLSTRIAVADSSDGFGFPPKTFHRRSITISCWPIVEQPHRAW